MGHVVPARDRGDQRLGAVAAGHPDHVGAAGDRVLGELQQVVAGRQHHGLDARASRHSSARRNFSTFPPPDFGFMISTGCRAAATGVPGVGAASRSVSRRRSANRAACAEASASAAPSAARHQTRSPMAAPISSSARPPAATASPAARRRPGADGGRPASGDDHQHADDAEDERPAVLERADHDGQQRQAERDQGQPGRQPLAERRVRVAGAVVMPAALRGRPLGGRLLSVRGHRRLDGRIEVRRVDGVRQLVALDLARAPGPSSPRRRATRRAR